jgi:hypothetical protein
LVGAFEVNPPIIVAWLWQQNFRRRYSTHHANVLQSMVRRRYPGEHRFVLITDSPDGFEGETVPIWKDHSQLPHISGGFSQLPSCYRRLKLFSREITDILGIEPGTRIISLDLDVVLLRDMSPLWDRPESFVGWLRKGTYVDHCFNGSMWMLRAGTHPEVWQDFDPLTSPKQAFDIGYRGSDQAWMSYKLAGSAHWSKDDGVVSFSRDLKLGKVPIAKHVRFVAFHGIRKPWDQRKIKWVRNNWR